MIKELEKYKDTGSFTFTPFDKLKLICNAPVDKAGIYIIYALKAGQEKLVYIGRSGKKEMNGSLFIRKGGIKDRLVNGKRDGEKRVKFWTREMLTNKIELLKIYWYITHNEEYTDCPAEIEDKLIKTYKPLWNR